MTKHAPDSPGFENPSRTMEKEEVLSEEERSRVVELLHTCFRDVDDFEKNVTYKFVVQSNSKSFWSKVIRVHLDWKNEQLAKIHPKSIFMKIPRISDNVKNVDNKDYTEADETKDAEVLLTLTKYEVSWYQCYGHDNIPHFPMPKFYGAEDVTEPGTGILALEDLTDRVKAMELFPGFSITQLERIMDALAGFHYHFISKKDQSWVPQFDRTSEIDGEFQDLQFDTAMVFENLRPDLFKGKITAMKEYFSIEAAINAQYSFEELDVPPVLVHFDMNPTNLLWDPDFSKLVAVIDFQLLHVGNFAEDIARILMLTMTRQQRWKNTDLWVSSNVSMILDQVHEAYDRIFVFSWNFAIFAMGVYYNMYKNLEKDDAKLAEIRDEIIDRAYGTVVDVERLLHSRRSQKSDRNEVKGSKASPCTILKNHEDTVV
ncbi:hypothetical protein ANCCEY_00043 [Ancylostoma ceylanicum]|uniref:CHK kinase-like domain-containing protein n=1 Tax=Ancylostoma ceylanicum TaxID=53326 RepID=A0A0D6MC24_9BILA|nr:hypothetical protein ANCCEY_00043 [Ancylostoma ceylanicum]